MHTCTHISHLTDTKKSNLAMAQIQTADDNNSDAASHASSLPSHRTRQVRGNKNYGGRQNADVDARGDSDVRITASSKEDIIKDWGFTDPVDHMCVRALVHKITPYMCMYLCVVCVYLCMVDIYIL